MQITHAIRRDRSFVLRFIALKVLGGEVDVAAGSAGVPACYVVL